MRRPRGRQPTASSSSRGVKDQPRLIRAGSSGARQVELDRWSQSPGQARYPARQLGQTQTQTQTRPDPSQAGLARHEPRVAWLRGSVFRAALHAQTKGCVSRRDLRLTTVRQGEQGGGRRHVPGLRPLTTSAHSRRCASGAGIRPGPGIGPDTQTPQRRGHPGDLESVVAPALAVPARSPGQPHSRAIPPAARAATAGVYQRRRTRQVAFQLRGQLAPATTSRTAPRILRPGFMLRTISKGVERRCPPY